MTVTGPHFIYYGLFPGLPVPARYAVSNSRMIKTATPGCIQSWQNDPGAPVLNAPESSFVMYYVVTALQGCQ